MILSVWGLELVGRLSLAGDRGETRTGEQGGFEERLLQHGFGHVDPLFRSFFWCSPLDEIALIAIAAADVDAVLPITCA